MQEHQAPNLKLSATKSCRDGRWTGYAGQPADGYSVKIVQTPETYRTMAEAKAAAAARWQQIHAGTRVQ